MTTTALALTATRPEFAQWGVAAPRPANGDAVLSRNGIGPGVIATPTTAAFIAMRRDLETLAESRLLTPDGG